MHKLIQTKTSFELLDEDTGFIKVFPIKPYEQPNDCRGKIEALEMIKRLEKLPYLDIRERIIKSKR